MEKGENGLEWVETQFSNARCKLSCVGATIGTGGETLPSFSEK